MATAGRGREALESLRSIPLFSQATDADLELLSGYLIERRFPRNITVVEEGLPGDYMYVLREGRVKVTKLADEGREKILGFIDEGGVCTCPARIIACATREAAPMSFSAAAGCRGCRPCSTGR